MAVFGVDALRPARWDPPFRLCDFCRLPLSDRSTRAYNAHVRRCHEHTAFRLDPDAWLREYWRVQGNAMLRLERIAGRPDTLRPERIRSSPEPGATRWPSSRNACWGVLGRSVFNHPDLAREYGAWRLERMAAEYERLADHFRRGDKVQDQAGHLGHRILTLPR